MHDHATDVIHTADGAELAANVESRRPGHVSIGVVGRRPGFAWVSIAEARRFSQLLLVAARDAEDAVL